MPTMATSSLKLDAETKARVQHLADARQRSVHWLMRQPAARWRPSGKA